MSIQRIEQNARMSQASRFGDMVVLSGQVADEGNTVEQQTRNILSKVDALLSAAGSDKSRIMYVTIWLADMSTYNQFNEVWDAWVPANQSPSRACVQAKLVKPEWLVEVQVFAVA